MKEIELAVLTKSSKFSGYCVAGIDYESGKWIRLVTEDSESHGAVGAEDLTYENGEECQILDVVNVPITGIGQDILQPENVLMDTSKHLRLSGKITIEDVLKKHPAEVRKYILGNKYPYITEAKVGQLGYSLTLVKVSNLLIKQVSNPGGHPKTKADFTYQSDRYENISVTDYRFYSTADGTSYRTAYLVVSIGTLFRNKYYKFVSTIYV